MLVLVCIMQEYTCRSICVHTIMSWMRMCIKVFIIKLSSSSSSLSSSCSYAYTRAYDYIFFFLLYFCLSILASCRALLLWRLFSRLDSATPYTIYASIFHTSSHSILSFKLLLFNAFFVPLFSSAIPGISYFFWSSTSHLYSSKAYFPTSHKQKPKFASYRSCWDTHNFITIIVL